ncbi:MAG TPA: hypothetical protein VLB09_05510 [Nitrospiria bacterium]|nr:hypothetical protein [Nitrospiria bacterium]
MKIHHLYSDADGESHFANLEIDLKQNTGIGKLSETIPVTGLIFRHVPPTYDLDWHNAPRRQYIVNLDAGVRITASDGEVREIGAGEILLVEDTTGMGHLSQSVAGQARNCLFITLD